MCNKEEVKNSIPFEITCTNCGSHDVIITAFDHLNLEIKCKGCGAYLNCGRYNQSTWVG